MRKPTPTELTIVLFIVACVIIAFSIQVPPANDSSETSQNLPSNPPQAPGQASQGQAQVSDAAGGAQHAEASPFCLDGCPTGAPASDQLVIHHILQLENNPRTKFADWVAYRISAEMLGKGCKRTWEQDPDLPSDATLRPADYRDIREALASDRGHQAPLASLCGSPDWQEADYLSNITPQKTDLNEGTWEHLENAERDLVKEGITPVVYSLTGPLYEREMPKLPNAHLETVTPSGYWKVISYKEGETLYAAAFIMDQNLDRDADYCSTSVMIVNLESRAHLKFFPNFGEPVDQKAHRDDVLRALGC